MAGGCTGKFPSEHRIRRLASQFGPELAEQVVRNVISQLGAEGAGQFAGSVASQFGAALAGQLVVRLISRGADAGRCRCLLRGV